MLEQIMANEVPIRLGAFFGILTVMGLWELLSPRRKLTTPKGVRWLNNLGIVFFNSLVLRLVFPVVAVGAAAAAQQQGWGILNHVELPVVLEVVLAVVIMDGVIYLQHVMVHAVPLFWRLHRMHHADLDYDVTTGARFHPLEIILSMGIKLATVVLLGPAPVAVLIFEVLLNGTAMFNHGNVRLNAKLDKVLRLFVVTPDMHRVHHSTIPSEANTNFGFNLPWWDRIFMTYRAQPEAGHEGMTIGISQFRDKRELWLDKLLLQPFRTDSKEYPIGGKKK